MKRIALAVLVAGIALTPATVLAQSTSVYSNTSRWNMAGPYTFDVNAGAGINVYNTAFGIGALAGNPQQNENTAFGSFALGALRTNGGSNVAVGSNALQNLDSGNYNTGIGSNAGRAYQSGGGGNVAIGHGAAGLDDFTPTYATGLGNTHVGSWSGQEITSGSRNSCYGMNACMNLTVGSNNTAIGFNAISGTMSGTATAEGNPAADNTAVGYEALRQTRSNGQVAVGNGALTANVYGIINTAVGYLALASSINGVANVAIGHASQLHTNGGSYNVSVGRDAMLSNVDGSQNTAIGDQALLNVNYSNVTAVGFQATATGSNQAVLGNFNVVKTYLYGVIQNQTRFVSNLPACDGGTTGSRAFVLDATSDARRSVVSGGGSLAIAVSCNGSAWLID